MADISGLIGESEWFINITNPGQATDRVTIFINYFVNFAALVAAIMIIVAGYTLITSSGDPEKVAKGRGTLVAAIVGLIVVFLIKFIIQLVLSFLN